MFNRPFLKNKKATSIMYDAVLFVVMVSLSGVILVPALQNNISVESSIKKHQEHTADETLNTLLVSRADKFEYNLLDSLLNSLVGNIFEGNDIYESISDWLLGHEQLHKTYANLIAENLGCQFSLLSNDFDKELEKSIKNFLKDYLGDKYGFRFTAVWRPINNIKLGEIEIGEPPDSQDCFVSQAYISMPYNSTQSFEKATGLSASSDDLLSIQRAEVRLNIWQIRG